jgi:capsid protein
MHPHRVLLKLDLVMNRSIKKNIKNRTNRNSSTAVSTRSTDKNVTLQGALQQVLGDQSERYMQERMAGLGDFGTVPGGELNNGLSGNIGSSSTGRTRQDWRFSQTNLTTFNLKTITIRAIREYYQNPWLKAAILTLTGNILGPIGTRPKPRVLTKGKLNKALSEEFATCFSRFDDEIDDKFTFCQRQFTIISSVIVTGNCFIVKTKNPSDDPVFTFGIDLFDTSHLEFNKDTLGKNKDGSYVQYGIKYDKQNKPVEYYFKENNTFKASEVIHVYYPERAQQRMGISWFVSSLPALYDIGQLQQNQLLSSRVSAGLLMWMKKGIDKFSLADDVLPMSPLNMILSEDKPEIIEGTSKVSQELIPLIKQTLQAFAASLGVSYSAISRNMDGESYSGGRLRNMADQMACLMYFKFFCKAGFQPVYRWMVEDSVNTRQVSLSIQAYKKDRYSYHQCYWAKQEPDFIDPLDHTKNLALKRTSKLMTDKQYCESINVDLEEWYDQFAAEKKMRKDRGIQDEGEITESTDSTVETSQSEKQKEKEKLIEKEVE